jgi:hypothetical protein
MLFALKTNLSSAQNTFKSLLQLLYVLNTSVEITI